MSPINLSKEDYLSELFDLEMNKELVKKMLPKTAADNAQTVRKYLKENYPPETLEWVKSAEWELKEIPLKVIKMARRPGGAREMDKVKGIAEAVKEGKPMEPVVLVKTPSDTMYKIADGYHRTLGFNHAGKTKIKAWVGKVDNNQGPWDKEMHEKKLNVGKQTNESIDGLNKEAWAAPLLGGLGRLALKGGKSLGNQALKAGKTLSGTNVLKAKKNKTTIMNNEFSTAVEKSKATKDLRKSIATTAGSWGLVGTGVAGSNYADKMNSERKKMLEMPEPPKVLASKTNP